MKMSRNIQSLERGIAVLETVVKNEPIGVTDLATQLDLDKTIVHRLLTTLQVMGYVQKDANRKYLVGARFRMISAKVLSSVDLRTQALPYMQQLAEATKGVAHLAKMAEGRAIYIERVHHPEFNVQSTPVGGEAPGYCSAAGKILWAYLGQEQLNTLLENLQFKQHTPNTMADRQTLQRYLAQVQEQGYALDNEEHRLGIIGVGAPVLDFNGNVIASICVGCALGTDAEVIQKVRDLVLETANALSHDMGYGNGEF
jgi:IclR family transcriptional regulator, KDG regulon repressor